MRSKVMVGMMVLVLATGLLMFSGCTGQTIKSDAAVADNIVEHVEKDASAVEAEEAARRAAEAEAARLAAEREAQRLAAEREAQRLAAEREAQRLAEEKARRRARNRFINEHIHFEFDSATLTPAAMAVLKAKAAWLRDRAEVKVIIEGHCDERGTDEYNLALGERRAQSARDFLQDTGISAARLYTVSYGEESPLDPRHEEAAWAKNRRVQFTIK